MSDAIEKMSAEHVQPSYQSSIQFDPNRIHAAAVYCSDGRFGEQFDDLLHNALELPRYDRLAVPGGAPAWRVISQRFGKKRASLNSSDMRKAIRRVRSISREITVSAFFARKNWDGMVPFELVEF